MFRRRPPRPPVAPSAPAETVAHGALAPGELDSFAEIDRIVCRLFALVADGLAAATDAFLDADRDAANRVVAADRVIDDLQLTVEAIVDRLLTHRGSLTDSELHLLVAVVRIVPELERSGDLVEHIALRTSSAMCAPLTPRARGLVAEMGRGATAMWRLVADSYLGLEPDLVPRLRSADDELDDLHVRLTAELACDELPTSIAIELGLVARFFERLGDHAVNVGRRLETLDRPPLIAGARAS